MNDYYHKYSFITFFLYFCLLTGVYLQRLLRFAVLRTVRPLPDVKRTGHCWSVSKTSSEAQFVMPTNTYILPRKQTVLQEIKPGCIQHAVEFLFMCYVNVVEYLHVKKKPNNTKAKFHIIAWNLHLGYHEIISVTERQEL